MKTGGDILCAALEAHGITTAFGLPGSQTIGLYEALRRSRIRSVLATNELAAGFMANGYFRASGRMAPLLTIPGPGFTWALTAVAEALHDSVPLLHIAATAPSSDGRKYLQAIDQAAVARPLVKGTIRIDCVTSIAESVAAAVDLATRGEPGPVLLEYLPDVLLAPAADQKVTRVTRDSAASLPSSLVQTITDARRPVIIAGQACAAIAHELQRLVEMLRAPVLTTASARGVVPEDHPFSLGLDLERGNVDLANHVLAEADCVMVLACKLGYSGSGAFSLRLHEERMVRVDTSPETLASTPGARFPLEQSVESFVLQLADVLERRGSGRFGSLWTDAEVAQRRNALRQPRATLLEPGVGDRSSDAARFFGLLREALPRNAIVVTDSGLHQQMTRRHLEILAPRGLLLPSDFQSMGFGLAGAIGAAVAAPDRKVVAVIGDGGFAMSGLELLTAVREGIPLTVVMLNDGKLGRIRNEQLGKYGRTIDVELLSPDYRGLVQSIGARYFGCEEDNAAVLRDAIRHDGVSFVDVPAGDTRAVQRVRMFGLARSVAHRTIGPAVVTRIKRALRRR